MQPLSRILLPIVALVVLGVTGCASNRPEPLPDAMPAYTAPLPPVSREDTGPEAVTQPVEPTKPTYAGPWEDPASPLYNRTIYFDYDSSEIKEDYVPLMRTHARYLGSHTDRRVTLEGHTDERGTREYNLALGDQRAEAVKRFMLAEGVLPDQMTTLSYGEERPVGLGHNESSWRQNRRVIIEY